MRVATDSTLLYVLDKVSAEQMARMIPFGLYAKLDTPIEISDVNALVYFRADTAKRRIYSDRRMVDLEIYGIVEMPLPSELYEEDGELLWRPNKWNRWWAQNRIVTYKDLPGSLCREPKVYLLKDGQAYRACMGCLHVAERLSGHVCHHNPIFPLNIQPGDIDRYEAVLEKLEQSGKLIDPFTQEEIWNELVQGGTT